MIIENEHNPENSKVFDAYSDDSKKFEILMKKGIEQSKLMFQMVVKEESKKKIFCSLYGIETLRHMEVLYPYNSIDEVFFQICDYIDTNTKLNIKSSISISSNKAVLSIPINSRKYKQITFELKFEESELVEILLDTIDKLIIKNEEFEKRLSKLEEKIFPQEKKEIKKDNEKEFKGKFEDLTNTKTLKPHTEYISNIILLKNNCLASSSLDKYIKVFNIDTFEEILSIKENGCVDWIEQIKDGTLISCPRDNTIRLYEINDKSYININVIKQDSSAWKMKELENGKLISTMSNSDIKVWIKRNNTLECEFTIKNGGESYDILEIKKNEVVTLSGNNINFYDLNKRDKINSISGFESWSYNPGKKFCKANDELLLVCGTNNIFLVDFQAHQLIGKINCQNIVSLYKLSNNFVLSGQSNRDIKQWQCSGRDTKLFSYKNGALSSQVMSIFELNNIIITGDGKGEFKFWEFK